MPKSFTEARKLPQVLKEIAAEKSRSPRGGPKIRSRQDDLPQIIKGGSEIWNYRLTYPSGLTLGSQPTGVKSSIYNPPVERVGLTNSTMPQPWFVIPANHNGSGILRCHRVHRELHSAGG